MIQFEVDIPDPGGDFRKAKPGLLANIARFVLEALQAPNSPVPVRTGALKRSYGTRVEGDVIAITSDVDYAQVVEDRQGPVGQTLQQAEDAIARKVEQDLERQFRG